MSLRWAVVGCGRIASEITIPALMNSTKSRVVAFMDSVPGRARAAAERFGVPRWYDRLDALLDDGAVQAIYVATPNAEHAPVALQALAAGKHVLCEKPLGVSVEECEAMVAAARQHGVRLMVAQMSHLNAYNRRARELVAGGAVGTVVVARGYFSLLLPGRSDWRFDLQQSGGGALMDIGIYCVHTLRTVIGGEVVEVTAHVAPVPHAHTVDTVVLATMTFDSGAIAVFDCGFDYYSGNICHQELKIRGEGNGYQICGTRGVIGVAETFSEGGGGSIWAVSDAGPVDVQVHPVNPYVAEMDYVADCIEEGRPSELDGEEGLEDVRIMMAIYQAGRTGSAVRIRR